MKKIYIIALLFLVLGKTTAQNLIPFLGKNGQYGYANERGEIQIQPNFTGFLDFWPPKTLGMNTNQNNQPVFLLRNGMTIAGQFRAVPVVNYESKKGKTGDTLGDLLMLQNNKKWVFINQKTRQIREYSSGQIRENPRWFSVGGSNYHSLECRFEYGFCRIFRENGAVNFIGTDLKEVFPTDFLAAAVGGPDVFVVGDASQKMGIIDRVGKMRSPMVWPRLELAGREGYFLVNNAEYFSSASEKPERAGVLDSNGKLVIDTIYQRIKPAGKDYLIVHNKKGVGMVDYAGNWIFPLEYRQIDYVYDDLFIVKPNSGRANVVNLKREKQFKNDYDEITTMPYRVENKPFFNVKDGHLLGIADSTFQVFFSDTLTSIAFASNQKYWPKINQQFRILEGHNSYNNNRFGIRDKTGRRILPGIFHHIDVLPFVGGDLYLVKKDSLYGVFDTEGKVVFPMNFTDIRPEEARREWKDTIVWAKPVGSKMYSAFDKTGKKLPYPDNFKPTNYRKDLVQLELASGKPPVLVLSDGSRVAKPDAQEIYRMRQVATAEGGFLYKKDGDRYAVLDAFLKNVVPEGFVVPVTDFMETRLEWTGLLPVFQLPADFVAAENREKARVEAVNKPKPPIVQNNQNEAVKEAYPGVEEAPGQTASRNDLPKTFEACGVINARGEWVVPPQKGAVMVPLSHFLVQELSPADRGNNDLRREPYTIYRVNSTDKTPILVNAVRFPYFKEENNFTMLFGKIDPKTSKRTYAFFNEKGDQLTDFNIVNSGGHLQKSNHVTILDKNGQPRDLILDAKGKTLVDLGDMEAIDPPHERGSRWTVDFLVAQKRGAGLRGLIDSTGKTVLPFNYNNLLVLEKGKLLSCQNSGGGTDLLDWQGGIIFSSPQMVRFGSYNAQNGYLLASSDDLTVVISPDGKLMRTLPYKTLKVAQAVDFQQFAQFSDKVSNQNFWIDFVSGVVFRG